MPLGKQAQGSWATGASQSHENNSIDNIDNLQVTTSAMRASFRLRSSAITAPEEFRLIVTPVRNRNVRLDSQRRPQLKFVLVSL